MKGGRLVGLAAAALLSCASAPRPGAVPEGGAISRLATGPAAALPPADALALGAALDQAGLPAAALRPLVRAAGDPQTRAPAVELLVSLQRRLHDAFLVPSALDAEDAAGSSPDSAARVDLLRAEVDQRAGRLASARTRLERIAPESPASGEAQVLLGVVLADPRLPGGAQPDEASKAFRRALRAPAPQEDRDRLQALAQLGLARVEFGQRDYAAAVAAYEAVPRSSRFWPDALFENGFARFRAGDLGGALGSLQALHAPQLRGVFLPESSILEATLFFYACLYDASRASLAAFEATYGPMLQTLTTLVRRPPGGELALVSTDPGEGGVPRPVWLWIRANQRLQGVLRLREEVDRERAQVAAARAWEGPTASALETDLDALRATLDRIGGQLVRNRLEEAHRNLKDFADQAEIIRFETTKGDKELVEADVDQRKLLASQRLNRPRLPGPAWNYWRFDGESWLDEIGFYRATLKSGCPDARR